MSKLKYLSAATFVLKWSVLYPIDSENPAWKKVLYFFWSVFFVSSFVLMVMQCIVELAIKPFNLLDEGVLVMNTAIYISLFMNYIIFIYNAKNLVTLVTNINENFFHETDNGVEDLNMDFCQKLTEKMPVLWTISLVASAVFFCLQPLLIGTGRIMPVPGWFPYDYTNSPLYEISYVWELICQFNLGVIYGGSDMIYPSMTLIIGNQFKILASNIKNSFFYALWQCGINREVVKEFKGKLENKNFFSLLDCYGDIFELMESKAFHRCNINYFKKNIRHHQLLLLYCDDMNQIMGLFLMTKIIAAFFNVIFIAFSLITTGDYSNAMGLCSYAFFASSEIFLYTYSGQILTENADFLWTLYDAPWYLCDLEFRKTFLFLHQRVSKMIYTKAGGYFYMCAPMAVTCLRSIFSYVALLKELVGSEKAV